MGNRSTEVSSTIASGKRNTALSLDTHGDGTSNPFDTLIRTLLMRVSHPGTGLLHRTNASSELTAVAAVGPRSSDNNTSLAGLHGTADSDSGLSSPSAGVVDAKVGAKTVLDSGKIEASADRNAVGNTERGSNADINAVATGTDNNGGHLHVPVDKALSAVGHVRSGRSTGLTLLKIPRSNGLGSSVKPVLVDLRSDGRDALRLEKLFIDGDMDNLH
jgi:hypothetical protein